MATRRERKGMAAGKTVYTDNILPTPANVLDEFCNVWKGKRIGKFKVLCGGQAVLANMWY